MSVLHKKLWRDVGTRKLSLVTLVGIVAVGVGCYVGLASVYADLAGARDRYFAAQRLADVVVDLERAPLATLEQVRALPNVRAARGRVSLPVLIDLPGRTAISGRVISMPARRRPVINDLLLRGGTWFSGRRPREAIVNDAFARANALKPGDTVRVTLEDQQHEVVIVGYAQSPEFVYLIPPGGGIAPDPANFGVIYLEERWLRERVGQEGAFNQLIALTHDTRPAALERTLSVLEERLDGYGVLSAQQGRDLAPVRFFNDKLKGIEASTNVTPMIFLIVAALVLNVLMSRMVREQRGIVGTLRALGHTAWGIRRHYLALGLGVGLAGSALGVAFGVWMQGAMGGLMLQFYSLPALDGSPRLPIVGQAVAIAMVFSLLGTWKGVREAAKLQPAEAMRPPPPERGGRILLERLPFVWNRFGFRGRLVLRSVFRNPVRSLLTVLAAALATTLLVSTWLRLDAVDFLMDWEFRRVSRQDVTVVFRNPVGPDGPREVGRIPGVLDVEPELIVPCEVRRGAVTKRLAVTGMSPGNRLHTPLDARGLPIRIPSRGLVLSKKLSGLLGVGPGDQLRLRVLLGERRRITVAVVGVVDTYLGLSAYADLEYLARLVGEPWAANTVLARTASGAGRAAVLEALEDRAGVIAVVERERALSQIETLLGESLAATLGFLILFAGLIAFGSVLNTALVSLSERQREVGTLRVLGYTPVQVSAIFAAEAISLGGVGVLLGIGGGIGLAELIGLLASTELYRIPVVILPGAILIGAGLVFVFVLLAQLVVHRRIAALPWLDVLKIKE